MIAMLPWWFPQRRKKINRVEENQPGYRGAAGSSPLAEFTDAPIMIAQLVRGSKSQTAASHFCRGRQLS